MNKIALNKIKNALNTKQPLEAVKELIREYEELIRLLEWRNDVILKAKNLERNKKELKRISDLIDEYGIIDFVSKENIDAIVRDYFRNM